MNAPNLSPGSAVAGKYQIRSLLGHTGAAATYRAMASGGYEVSLKLFSPAVAQRPDIMQMIERIYGETNGLVPELIVPIIDAGYDPATGAPFGVTQIVPMTSLGELVQRRPLAPGEVSTIVKSIAKVLDNAHAREIMHHAIKPTNVFVDPAQGMAVRVMDFGANIPRSVVPTHEGYAHSAPWMAPEQVTGSSPAGPAADVFATALLAFYALTGYSYWRLCQGAAPDMNAWQQEIMSVRTPASARAAELGLRVSANLDSTFARALAHEPRDRFRSMGELAAAFEGALGACEPEMASTMAFPAVVDGPMGGSPQMGGYGPPPGAQGGQGGQGGDAGYPPPPVPYTGSAAYTATIPSSTLAIAPNPAPQPLPQRSASGRLAPIMVGVVALLLVGGGVGAWVVLFGRTPPPDPGPIAIATPQTGTAAAAASATPTATPTHEEAVAAPPSAAPTAAPAPAGVDAKITCAPACDEITIDEKKVEDLTKPITLTAGQHKVSVSKSGYKTQNDTITIADGKPFSKEYKLASAAAVAVAAPQPTKPAGGGGTPLRKCGKLIKTNCTK